MLARPLPPARRAADPGTVVGRDHSSTRSSDAFHMRSKS
eukprot:gene8105-368_t